MIDRYGHLNKDTPIKITVGEVTTITLDVEDLVAGVIQTNYGFHRFLNAYHRQAKAANAEESERYHQTDKFLKELSDLVDKTEACYT